MPSSTPIKLSTDPIHDQKSFNVPILEERSKRDLYTKVFKQEFIRELQYLWDVANDRATARSTFTEKLVDKLTALPEEIPVVGKAIEKLGPVLTFAASEVRDETIRCIASLFDQLDVRRLEILLDVVAREAYRRYEYFIERLLGDDAEKCVIPFAKIGVARVLEYMARKKADLSPNSYLRNKMQSVLGTEQKIADTKTAEKIKFKEKVEFSESFLLAGLVEGRSGSFIQGWTNNKVLLKRTKSGSTKLKEAEVEEVYGRSAMMHFAIYGNTENKKYYTREQARHKEKNWTNDVDNIWRGETEALYDFGRSAFRGNKNFKKDPRCGFAVMPLNVITNRYEFKETNDFSSDLKKELEFHFSLSVVEIDKTTLKNFVDWYRKNPAPQHTIDYYLREGKVKTGKDSICRGAKFVICHANLSDINLQGINLSKMDLSGAIISGDLTDTQFNDSYLIGTQFRNVSSAKKTNFQRAQCAFLQAENVDFSGANLNQADFSFAKLANATLSGCITLGTVWHQTDLHGIKLVAGESDLHREQAAQFKEWQAEHALWRAELNTQMEAQSEQFTRLMQLQKQMEGLPGLQEQVQNLIVEQETRRTFENYCRQNLQQLQNAVVQTADKQTVEDLQNQLVETQKQIKELQTKNQTTVQQFNDTYAEKITELGEQNQALKKELSVLQSHLQKELQTITAQVAKQLKALETQWQQAHTQLTKRLEKLEERVDTLEQTMQQKMTELQNKLQASVSTDELIALQQRLKLVEERLKIDQTKMDRQAVELLQKQQEQLKKQFDDRFKVLDEKISALQQAIQKGDAKLHDVEKNIQKFMHQQESNDEKFTQQDKKLDDLEKNQRQQALNQKEQQALLMQKLASLRQQISTARSTEKSVKPPIDPKLMISYFDLDFDSKLLLGEGSFAEIYLGRLHHQTVVIKKPKSRSNESLEELIREVNIMSRLRHRNVVQIYGASVEKDHPCLVMEHMERGSLKDLLIAKTELKLEQQINIALDIANGLAHIHYLDFIHRDLKSANILIDKYFQAKLADFGLTKANTNSIRPTHQSSQATTYLPPEAFNHLEHTKQSDIYCFGVLLWEIMMSKVSLENCHDKRERIMKGPDRELIPDTVPEVCQKIIKACWHVDPSQRPTLNQIIAQLNTYKEALECYEQGIDAEAKAGACRKQVDEKTNIGKKSMLEEDEKRYLSTAYSSYQKSIDKGCAKGNIKLGRFFSEGIGGVAKDPNKALNYYRLSAKQGHVNSMFNAARMLQKGADVAVNLAEALHWYEKAADKGDCEAMIKAAEILEKGDKVINPDTTRALNWYEKAAAIVPTNPKEIRIAQHAQKQCERLRLVAVVKINSPAAR